MKPVVRNLICEVLENNRKTYVDRNKDLYKYNCDPTILTKLKNEDDVIKKLPISSVSSDQFIAREVVRVKEIKDELALEYLLNLFRLNSDYMNKLFNKKMFRKYINNINLTKHNIESIKCMGNIKYFTILLESSNLDIEEIDEDVLYTILSSIKEIIDVSGFNKMELPKEDMKEFLQFYKNLYKHDYKFNSRLYKHLYNKNLDTELSKKCRETLYYICSSVPEEGEWGELFSEEIASVLPKIDQGY